MPLLCSSLTLLPCALVTIKKLLRWTNAHKSPKISSTPTALTHPTTHLGHLKSEKVPLKGLAYRWRVGRHTQSPIDQRLKLCPELRVLDNEQRSRVRVCIL